MITATASKVTGDMIKILPRVKKKIGAIKFVILGDGPEMDNLKKIAQKRLAYLAKKSYNL